MKTKRIQQEPSPRIMYLKVKCKYRVVLILHNPFFVQSVRELTGDLNRVGYSLVVREGARRVSMWSLGWISQMTVKLKLEKVKQLCSVLRQQIPLTTITVVVWGGFQMVKHLIASKHISTVMSWREVSLFCKFGDRALLKQYWISLCEPWL